MSNAPVLYRVHIAKEIRSKEALANIKEASIRRLCLEDMRESNEEISVLITPSFPGAEDGMRL